MSDTTPTQSVPKPAAGWSSVLARFCMAVLIFESVSGLAITLGPFHAAIQYSVLFHTSIGAITLPAIIEHSGFFLRGYIAFLEGDITSAAELLKQTRAALGPEWQPKGTTAEGDVKTKLYTETSPLRRFYDGWNGSEDPRIAFAALHEDLSGRSHR